MDFGIDGLRKQVRLNHRRAHERKHTERYPANCASDIIANRGHTSAATSGPERERNPP